MEHDVGFVERTTTLIHSLYEERDHWSVSAFARVLWEVGIERHNTQTAAGPSPWKRVASLRPAALTGRL